jgi:hypothetical protein
MNGDSNLVAQNWELKVTRVGPDDASVIEASNEVRTHPDVKKALRSSSHWRLLTLRFLDEISDDKSRQGWSDRYRATIVDYTNNRTLLVDGQLSVKGQVRISESRYQPLPTEEEFDEAVGIVRKDHTSEIASALRDGTIYAALSIPPLIRSESPQGTIPRILSVRFVPYRSGGTYYKVQINMNQESYSVQAATKIEMNFL